MANLLKNAQFLNGVTQTFAHWRGWYVHAGEAVCIYLKKVPNQPTGFYQDIPKDSFSTGGWYTCTWKVLTPDDNVTVKPTVWVFRKGHSPAPTQASYQLKKGQWQIVHVRAWVTRSNLKKVRAEIYVQPDGAELIVQGVSFAK